MSSLRKFTTWLAFTIVMVTAVKSQSEDFKVVCYYQDWSVYYKTKYTFTPKNIDAKLCTHLIYAFARFANDSISLEPFDSYQAIDNNGYKEFTGRKMLNPDLKTMISIGGYNEGSMRFSNIASDETQQKIFSKNVIKFLRKYSFDGVDIDWQYPGFRDFSRVEDKENYAKFMKTVSTEFLDEAIATGFPLLLLSISIPQKIDLAEKGFDIKNLNKYVDWFNVVGYNYHTAHESVVNHHSPLYHIGNESENDNRNLNYTVNYYLNAGADPQKLVLGIPIFGNYYTLTDPGLTAIGSPSEKPVKKGPVTDIDGYIAYFEICDLFLPKNESNTTISTDEDVEYDDDDTAAEWIIVNQLPNAGPYAFKGYQWICYDDVKIVAKKAEYVAENSLGGIMFWAIDNDDYLGNCHGETFPIIKAAKKALNESLRALNINKMNAKTSIPNLQELLTNPTTPDPYTVKVEIITSGSLQTVMTERPSTTTNPVTSTESIKMPSTKKPTELIYTPIITFPASLREETTSSIPIKSTEVIPSSSAEPRFTFTNRGKSSSDIDPEIYKSITISDSATTANINPTLDLIAKYVITKNTQPSQSFEFPLNGNDDTFDFSKFGKSIIYIKNIFTSNVNLKLNR